jgi:hypothetical protein
MSLVHIVLCFVVRHGPTSFSSSLSLITPSHPSWSICHLPPPAVVMVAFRSNFPTFHLLSLLLGSWRPALFLLLVVVDQVGGLRVVVQKLLDEVHVGQKHPPAAVPLQAELVQRVTVGGGAGRVRQYTT